MAILILGIGYTLVNSSGLFSQRYQEKIESDNINTFNQKILDYARNINAQDMVSLINFVAETNEKYSGLPDRKISVYLNSSVVNWTESEQISKMNATIGDQTPYRFVSVSYYDSGYIKSIKFKK